MSNGTRPLNIGLDFDNVIADCRKQKAAYAKEHFKKEIPYQMFKWHTTVNCGLLTPDECTIIGYAVHHSPKLNSEMEEVPGAREYIQRLQEDGHSVRVVTGRDAFATKLARQYLIAHGIRDIADQNFAIPITGVNGGELKAPACKGLDAFIDDDLDNLKPLVDVVPHRYLLTYEYNMHIAVPEGIATRVHSWKEFYSRIRSLG
jgi:hypothetical protein